MLQIAKRPRKHSIRASARLVNSLLIFFFFFKRPSSSLRQVAPINFTLRTHAMCLLAKRPFVLCSQKQLGISLQGASTVRLRSQAIFCGGGKNNLFAHARDSQRIRIRVDIFRVLTRSLPLYSRICTTDDGCLRLVYMRD